MEKVILPNTRKLKCTLKIKRIDNLCIEVKIAPKHVSAEIKIIKQATRILETSTPLDLRKK